MGVARLVVGCRNINAIAIAIRVLKDVRGQATVEMAITFPILIIVAAIAVNATLFISDCAAFDRVFRQSVRVCACSPAYEQNLSQSSAQVKAAVDAALNRDYLESNVVAAAAGAGQYTFIGTLDFAPNLFGRGFRSEVFGVALPHLTHEVRFVIDVYKPGILF